MKVGTADTEVHVSASTTQHLVKTEKGSVAFNRFPGGAKKLAESVLRAGMTYTEVPWVKPGEPSRMKCHLFFRTGGKWAVLGPLRRSIK